MKENRTGNRAVPFILVILLVGLSSSHSIYGDNQSALKNNNAQFTLESMNYPGSTIGSIYSQSTISASYSYTCVIIFDNTMKCWGQRGESPSTGYLGDGQINGNSFTPTEVLLDDEQGNSSAIETASYGHHSCAVMADYSLKCWGNDWNGQIGHNVSGGWHSTPFPTTMPNGLTAIQSAAGLNTSCAIMDDFSLWCWGDNDPQGQVGIGNTSQGTIATPQQIILPSNRSAISVSFGQDYGCTILDNGDGMCWGDNQRAQLGDGTTENKSSPALITLIPQNRRLVAIDVAFQTTCGILDNGSVLCWGRNDGGQFGDGTLVNYSSTISRYTILPEGRTAVSISVGQSHACAILDNGEAFCWGSNELGQLGDGSTINRSTPTRVSMPEGSVISTISAGTQHTCAILSNASVYCWGDNSEGQLGIGEGLVSLSPSFVDLGPNEYAMVAERDHDGDGVISIFDPFPNGCPAGTYSTNGTCLETNPGYFSDGNPPYGQIPCEPGQFQPLTGQDSCIIATPGHFVSGESLTNQTECSPGTYQPNYGQESCLLASIGYFVAESGATRQVACSPGSYQNQTNSTICIEASPGYFVSGGAAGNQTACNPGTYQNLPGQITCLEVEIGFQASSLGSASQEQCQPGTFSAQTGQSQCTEASPGYFVSGVQQEEQYPCQLGEYQPSSAQEECLLASPGNYTDSEASVNQNPCPSGSYQPLSGQASCIQTDPGNFSLDGATSQSPCLPGTFQPDSGNSECIDAEPGHYVDLDGSEGQIPCPQGQFQGESGTEGCLDAPAGEVASPDGTSTIPCSPGTYKPENQNSCIQASPGNFVNQTGAISQTPCEPGSFSDTPGVTDCELADPGNSVPESGASSQTPCSKGEFQSYGGQSSCNQAMPGHHVPQEGALSQTSCRPGNYQSEEGQEECLPADPGNFVPSSGSTSQSPCQPGSFQSSSSSTICQPSDPGHFVEEAGAVEQLKCPTGYEQELTGQTACEKIKRPLWLTILMFGVPAIVLGTMAVLYLANKKKKGAGGRGKAYMYSEDLRRR